MYLTQGKVFVFVIMLSSAFLSYANEEYKASYIPIFSINKSLEKLAEKSQSSSSETTTQLNNLNLNFDTLNPAEQYLYYISLANGASGVNQHQQIISYLLKAQALEAKINQDQLNHLLFLNLYKKLANSYAGTGQFKKAYEAKSLFITKYDKYLENERAKHTFKLEEKYETHRKQDINTLLNNQTEIKALEINELLNNEIVQRRNIYIVSFLVIIFFVFLLRLLAVNKRIQRLSQEDILTGIRNRKTLFSYGQSAIENCIEGKSGLCVLAMNIDNFKLLNDIHGDYIGDEILKKFALLGKETMRTRDVFGRLEDATFIAVLPEASIDEAKAIAQHLKRKVTEFRFNYVGIQQQLDLSISIVELSESLSNFELLLNTAMNIQYEIKDAGGDQIKIYQQYA